MLACDLHVHTSYSRDGESRVVEVLRRASEAGLDAIAITDHDTMAGVREAMALHPGVLIIPGMEISTQQGHLIALGITREIPPRLDFHETVALAREQGAVLILPHPFHMWRHGVGRKLRDALASVDAIEVFNSRYITGSANRKAARYAGKLGKSRVGGSDAHNARYIGFGRTLIDADRSVESILAALREGRTAASGRMTPLRTYTRQSLSNTWRRFSRRVRLR